MSNIDWFDSGTGLLNGVSPGGSSGGSSSGWGAGALGLGSLAIGGAGLGLILGQGESPLPSEFSTLTNEQVPQLQADANWALGQGQILTGQGEATLNMAATGQLTPEQQAQLKQYSQGLNNQAIQTYASMGRNYNQDTSAISTQADIDAKVNAMAQQQIQSTIALGMSQLSAGENFTSQAGNFTNAANQALIAAGQAQVQQDQAYRQSLTGAFSAIGQMFGAMAPTIAKAAPLALAAL